MTVQIPRSYSELKERVPNIGTVILAILSWFIFSLLISLYNKWMFSDETLDFKFPVLITACHQFVLFWLSVATLSVWPKFRLNYIDPSKSKPGSTPETISYLINPKIYITKILPCALASAGDIGLGNSSLKYITISLYTMLKSSAVLIFTLFWGFILRLEKVTAKLCMITLIMTLSVMMLLYGQNETAVDTSHQRVGEEADEMKLKFIKFLIKRGAETLLPNGEAAEDDSGIFSEEALNAISEANENGGLIEKGAVSALVLGCFLVLLASCMSGLRWALTQIVLRGNKYTKNPILTIFYLSPAMSFTLFVMGSQVEGLSNFTGSRIWTEYGTLSTMLMLLFPGCLAFCMTLSQFVILQYAPLLTLSIAGVVREVITIFLGWIIFGDKLNFVNIIGILVTLSDITWYNLYRLEMAGKKEEVPNAIAKEDRERLLDSEEVEMGGIESSGN